MRLYTSLILLCLTFFWSCKKHSSGEVEFVQEKSPVDTTALLMLAEESYKRGEFYDSIQQKDSALYFHQIALSYHQKVLVTDKRLLDSFHKVALYYHNEFKYDVADRYYDKARIIAENIQVAPIDLIELYINTSGCKTNLKDAATSFSLLQKAMQLTDTYLPDRKDLYHRIYFTLASNYFYLGDYANAIKSINQSISYLGPKEYLQLGISNSFLGSTAVKMRDFDRALDYFNHSTRNLLKSHSQDSDELAKVYLPKAFVHYELGEIDSAEYYLKLNLSIREVVHGKKSSRTFGAKYSLGKFYMDIMNYDSALKYSHESLLALVKDFNDHNVFSNPTPDQTELNTDLLIGLVAKATALMNIDSKDSIRQTNLQFALKTFFLADSVYSIFLRSLLYDDPQLLQMETGYIPYPTMIRLAFELYQESSNSDFVQKALAIIEQSRSRLLGMALRRAEFYGSLGIPSNYQETEQNLIKQRSEVLRQLQHNELAKSRYDSLYRVLLSITNQFLVLQQNLEEINPNYFQFKYQNQTVTIREIRDLLKQRNGIFIDYLWDPENIFALAIYKDSVKFKSITQTGLIKRALADFVVELTGHHSEIYEQGHFDRFCKSSNDLYRELLEDILPKNQNAKINLIISADGPLGSLPFEALITQIPTSNEVNYHLPYLINEYPISYAQSINVLIAQSKANRTGDRLLAFGFAGSGDSPVQRNALINLPGTEKEIQSIHEVMQNDQNQYYLQGEASEFRFKKLVADFDVVHLALHGVADSVRALESRLIFRTEKDSVEDGNLYAHELYSLNLKNLDLAVLSACESGLGKKQSGEGVMSIARGFAYAGCPSLIISLWKIDDRTSADVMSNLYTHLSNGVPVNEALAKAKTDYINSAGEFTSHPWYWAAFLQVGDSRSISKRTIHWEWIVLGVIMLIILLLGYRKLRKAH